MATGNMLLGQSRGKVGSLVFYRRNGKQVTRSLAASVSNPNTQGQAIQRMIFGTTQAAYKRMRSIVNHSFEGVKYGAPSMANFMKLNLKRLRNYYAFSLTPAFPDSDVVDDMAFSLKGNDAESGTGLIISQGSIPAVPYLVSSSGTLKGFGSVEFAGTPKISEVMASLGAVAGDQITICALVLIGEDYEFQKSRYVINADASAADLAANWDTLGSSAAFDQTRTQVGALTINGGEETSMQMNSSSGNIVSCGIIISRKSDSGKWLRSSAVLINNLDEPPQYQGDYALPSWLAGATQIDTTSDKYLNNAE